MNRRPATVRLVGLGLVATLMAWALLLPIAVLSEDDPAITAWRVNNSNATGHCYCTTVCNDNSSIGAPAQIVNGVCDPRGDLNCDGRVNNFDIDSFVEAITDPIGYQMHHPNCDVHHADINRDGRVDNFDIDGFVACLTGGCP